MIPRRFASSLFSVRSCIQSPGRRHAKPYCTQKNDGQNNSETSNNNKSGQDKRPSNIALSEVNEGISPETFTSSSVKELLSQSEVVPDKNLEPEFPSDITEKHSQKSNFDAWQQSQEKHAFRPKVDPRETSIFLFPGQGSQFVGMASKLLPYPNVKEMFEVASEILEYDLLKLCLEGPKSTLDSTIFCQPAIFVTSLAAVEKLRDENPQVTD